MKLNVFDLFDHHQSKICCKLFRILLEAFHWTAVTHPFKGNFKRLVSSGVCIIETLCSACILVCLITFNYREGEWKWKNILILYLLMCIIQNIFNVIQNKTKQLMQKKLCRFQREQCQATATEFMWFNFLRNS